MSFLDAVRDACERHGDRRGWVGGVRRGRRTSLVFSHSVPRPFQQQLRNAWLLEG